MDFLKESLTEEEISSLAEDVKLKLTKTFEEQADEITCLKALVQSEKKNNDEVIQKLEKEVEINKANYDESNQKLSQYQNDNEELNLKLSSIQKKFEQVEDANKVLEKSIDELRHQRDTSLFNANALQSQLEFKQTQISQMKDDMTHLQTELEKAVQAKFDVLVNKDELDIRSKELDLKEAQFEKDKNRLQHQVNVLNNELDRRNNELLESRKQSDKLLLDLQTKLELKTNQLNNLQAAQERLKKSYNEREKELSELQDKLTGQAQDEIDYRVHLEAQLTAQKSLALAHQEAYETAKYKCEELETLMLELKTKLDESNTKIAALELENDDLKKELEVRVEHFNEQMKAADDMLFAAKSENWDQNLEHISPYAALVSKKMKEGLTFTDIMKMYADASEELVTKQTIIENLQMDISRIMDELQDAAPKIRQKSERLHQALELVQRVTEEKDKLEISKSDLEQKYNELKTQYERERRENERNKNYVKDLSKQLCMFIKKEAEDRGIPIPITGAQSPNVNRRASLDLNSLVNSRLLTFSCIEELQQRNLELLEAIRVCEKEIESKQSALVSVKKEHSFCEEKSKLEKDYEDLKVQYETQKQHMKYLTIILRQRDSSSIDYDEDFKSFSARTKVSVDIQTDISSLKYGTKEYEALEKKFNDAQKAHETRVNELLQKENKLQEELRKIETEASDLKIKLRKIVVENEYKEEINATLRHNFELKSNQTESLEKSCQTYRENLMKTEAHLASSNQQLTSLVKKLSSVEIERDGLRREVLTLNEKVRDLNSERELHLREKSVHSHLLSQIEGIKNQMQLSDSIGKAKLESRLEESLKEVNGLRHKLQEEQSMHTSKVEMLNKNLELLRTQLTEEIEFKNQARLQVESAQQETKLLQQEIDNLKQKINDITNLNKSNTDKDKELEQLSTDIQKLKNELAESKKMVAVTKENEKAIQEICSTFENHCKELTAQNSTIKETYETRISDFAKQISTLQTEIQNKEKQISILRDENVSKLSKLSTTTSSSSSQDVNELTRQLEETKLQLKLAEAEREKAVNNYSRELQMHADDTQELARLKGQLSDLNFQITTLENEKITMQAKLSQYEQEVCTKRDNIEVEKLKVKEELEELRKQNENLYNALEELGNKTNQSLNEIENSSFKEEDQLRGNENVISIIRHLRQQSSLSKMEKQNVECENRSLQSNVEMLKRKLSESNELLNAERNKNKLNEKTLDKHAELIKKIEMMELVSDSNRILREDRDRLQEQIDAINKEKETFEQRTVDPLKTKINQLVGELEVRNQQVEHLKKQTETWKKRCDELLEKANRWNPEDIKRLTLEKETLSKQLVSERESYRMNLEELKTLRGENSNIKAQLSQLQSQVTELTKSKEELTTLKVELEQTKSVVEKLTQEQTNVNTQLEQKTKELTAKDTVIENLKVKEVQIRNIARKYKTQYEETVKQLDEKNKLLTENKEAEEKKMNEAMENMIKEKDELIAKCQSEKSTVEQEMNSIKQTFSQREERMKEVLKKCKQKMATQVLEITQLKKQNPAAAAAIAAASSQPATGQSTVSAADYEEMEKKLSDMQEEKDKLKHDYELLQQKNNMLARHFSGQNSKPSTSTSSDNLGGKVSLTEPPTANIKPMAGASTSSVKHPATTQQSVTVQPWRDPPLASIRPLFCESRTVVVPPTTAVVPQVQVDPLEPSSSHTDYMPSQQPMPSSQPNTKQATVLPTTQTPRDSAESSTQNEDEMESTMESEQQTPASQQQLSVALVLPQERQDTQPQDQQLVTGSTQGQQIVSASSQTAQQVTGSTQTQQLVTGSTQDETVSQQYRQEVPSTSTSQQLNENSSNNTVTTSRAEFKRGRPTEHEALEDDEDDHLNKRRRIVEVEYQVPTSSQRDQEDDIVLQDSDEEEMEGDNGEGEEPDDGGVDLEQQDEFDEEGEEDEEEEEEEGDIVYDEQSQDYDEQNTPQNASEPSSSQPQAYEEGGDDSIVPSTPTLSVPRRTDAVSSPHVPSGRFTFSDFTPGAAQDSESDDVHVIDMTSEEAGTSRSVPTTPVAMSASNNVIYVDQVVTMAPCNFNYSRPLDDSDTSQDMPGSGFAFVVDITDSQSEVSSEGERQEQHVGEVEEGREAEAVAQRIPLVTMRGVSYNRTNRGIRSRGNRNNTPVPIVWEESENTGTATRGRGSQVPSLEQSRGFRSRASRRGGRPFNSFNRYLP